MVDTLSQAKRSWVMSRIRSKDTKPERVVRSLLHRQGFRFRLHKKDLPGKPDIVLAKYQTVIFVHGCFWHRHKDCRDATTPKTRTVFWKNKFKTNTMRDERSVAALRDLGWNVVVVWECETRQPESLLGRLKAEVRPPSTLQKHLGCITEENYELPITNRESLRVASGVGDKYEV